MTLADSNFEHLFFTVTVRETSIAEDYGPFLLIFSLYSTYETERFMAMLHFTSCVTALKTQLAIRYTSCVLLSTFGSNLLKLSHEWNLRRNEENKRLKKHNRRVFHIYHMQFLRIMLCISSKL